VKIEYASVTHIGVKRDHNEDSCFPDPEGAFAPVSPEVLDVKGQLFIVADGMGGMAAGEVASRMAIETILTEYYSTANQVPPLENLTSAIKTTNFGIFNHSSSAGSLQGMGTTVTALVLQDGRAHIAHVGDSRAYLHREGSLKLLTNDHSWVAEQVRSGVLTLDQAKSHEYRHVLTRALGTHPHVEVDRISLSLVPGDVLLLCTDGLTSLVQDDQIANTLASNDNPRALCEALVTQANQAGGEDNITVVLIQYGARQPGRKASKTEPIAPRRFQPQRLVRIIYLVLGIVVISAIIWYGYSLLMR
jgi:serine/threonine protein phosphatase PrpC